MKVKKLIEKLQKLDPEMNVILQKDSEGNGYSPLCGVEEAFYEAYSTYSGDVYSIDDHDASEITERVAVLWPVN